MITGCVEARFAEALRLHKRGRTAQAAGMYRQVLDEEPAHPGALHLLGVALHQLGRPEEGLEYIRRALALCDTNAIYWNNYGAVLKELGRLEQAQRAFERAVRLRDSYPDAWSNLGLVHCELGRRQEAYRACSWFPGSRLGTRAHEALPRRGPTDAVRSPVRASATRTQAQPAGGAFPGRAWERGVREWEAVGGFQSAPGYEGEPQVGLPISSRPENTGRPAMQAMRIEWGVDHPHPGPPASRGRGLLRQPQAVLAPGGGALTNHADRVHGTQTHGTDAQITQTVLPQASRPSRFRRDAFGFPASAFRSRGRWVRKVLDTDGDSTPEQSRIFVYDGNQITLDLSGPARSDLTGSDLQKRYLWGPAVDQILAEEDVGTGIAEDVLWALTDHLNTARDLVRFDPANDTTSVENHLVYDAFGNLTSQTDLDLQPLFLFTARPFDADTGLQNNLHRWYDPAVGRWLSEDPIGFLAFDPNLYRYVENAAAHRLDPLGLKDYKLGTEDPEIATDPGAGEHGSDPLWLDDWLVEAAIRVLMQLFRRWPNARAHLSHYLDNSGKDYVIDLEGMLRDCESAQELYKYELDLAKEFVEGLPPGKYQITSGAASGGYNEEHDSADWFYAVGGYSAWGKGTATVKCLDDGTMEYELDFEYKFRGRYNWDTGKSVEILGITATDKFMGDLHRAGVAKEFDMFGSVRRKIKWRKDETSPPTEEKTEDQGRPGRW